MSNNMYAFIRYYKHSLGIDSFALTMFEALIPYCGTRLRGGLIFVASIEEMWIYFMAFTILK